MKRCQKCILPENYPGIQFDAKGECNFCLNHKLPSYLGEVDFIMEIQKFLNTRKSKNIKYDCILGFSGGRDSSYLLYWLTRKLNLRVLAYTVDNGILPTKTKENIKKISDTLNVESVIETNNLLKKCFKHTMSVWMARPSLAMTEILCTGCRLGLHRGIYRYARNNNIPIIISGVTPLEQVPYRENLMKINSKGGIFSAMLGYFSQIMRNPRWIMNYTYLNTQIKEFYHYFYNERIIHSSNMLLIAPFYKYVRWDEQKITSILESELNWQKESNLVSTWRSDCKLALLKLYIYKKALGYNDKLDHLCNLIRDGQLNREDAIKRLEKEETIAEEIIKEIIEDFSISYLDFNKALKKI